MSGNTLMLNRDIRNKSGSLDVLLGSIDPKVSDATVSGAYEEEQSLDSTPLVDERWVVTEVQLDIAADYTFNVGGQVAGILSCAFKVQMAGNLDGAFTEIGTRSYAATALDCTNNAFEAKSVLGLARRSRIGASIIIRWYLKIDLEDGTSTGYCVRNARLRGNKQQVRRSNKLLGQLRGGD